MKFKTKRPLENRASRAAILCLSSIFLYFTTVHSDSAPVANADSAITDKYTAVAVTLSATGAPLTYSVVTDPVNGTLEGIAPDLTYIPNTGYIGADSFTFKANDGQGDSNIATFAVTVNEVVGAQVYNYTAATPGTVKTYKVAVLMINTLRPSSMPVVDNPNSPKLEFYSPEKLGDIFFNHQHGASAYIQEASYGKVALEGTVVGWLDAPQPELDPDLSGNDIAANMSFYVNLAKQHITFDDYDIFVIHGLAEGLAKQTGWAYPLQSITTDQGVTSGVGITWMINSGVFDEAPLEYSNWSSGDSVLPTTSWSHELIHTFGIFGHSNSYDCGDVSLAINGAVNPEKGYGDSFSLMGEFAWSTHPDPHTKLRLGWIEPEQLPEITTTGIYEVAPLVIADGLTKGLVIPLDTTINYPGTSNVFDALIIEYRTATGFDRYLERLDGSTFLTRYSPLTDIDRNGVIVRLRNSSLTSDSTALLDMNPTTAYTDASIKHAGNPGKFADAILPVGNTFTWEGITISPLGTTAEGAMQVSVTLDSVVTHAVTFVEGANGSRTSGGALSQTINDGADAAAPTITPNAGYIFDGWDVAFTNVTSNLTVTAQYAINTPPEVAAGPDQTVTAGVSSVTPAWSFSAWTGDADSGISDQSTYTAAHCFGDNHSGSVTVNGVVFDESFSSSGTGWSFANSGFFNHGDDDVSVTGNSEDLAEESLYNNSLRTVTFSGLTVGASYEANFYSAGLGSTERNQTFSATGGASSAINQNAYGLNNGIRITYVYQATSISPEATTTSQVFTIDPSVGRFDLYAMSNRLTAPPAEMGVNLNGTVSDDVGPPLTTWSVIGGDPGSATIGDTALVDTTATFFAPGIYTLRLTADDGLVQVSDDVIITVVSAIYNTWTTNVTSNFSNPSLFAGNETNPVSNPDGDSMSNLLEFAFGTDPTLSDSGSLVADGSVNGQPLLVSSEGSTNFDFLFVRRDDHGTSGSLTYTPQFSGDLATFHDSVDTPTLVVDSTDDTHYEVVKVPFPTVNLPDGKKARFGRINVTETPTS